MTDNNSLVDKLVQKILPIVGVLFIVGGLSYLFYTWLWGVMDKTARLAFGFFIAVAFMGSGFGLQQKLKQFSDVIIGGGILIFYISLIYWSRFESPSDMLIPEVASLGIALLFALAVWYFSQLRQSRTILGMGILGAYMTPFFLGQEWVWDFQLGYNSFLIYFLGINIALFFAAKKIFLKDIVLFNMMGLFVASASMNYLYTSGTIDQISLVLFVAIIGFSIYTLASTSQAFEKSENTYFALGCFLPILWFIGNTVLGDDFSSLQLFISFWAIAAIYFWAWYTLRNTIKQQEYIPMYIGWVAALIMMILSFQQDLEDYVGLVIGLVSIVFAGLYLVNPLKQRLLSYFGMALFGGIVNALIFGAKYNDAGSYPYLIIIGFIPLMLGFIMSKKVETAMWQILNIFASFSAVISGLILINRLYIGLDIPLSFIFLTVPALVIMISLFVSKNDPKVEKDFIIGATILAVLWYFVTFFILLDRIYPAPVWIYPFHTRESLIGITSAIIFYGLLKKQRNMAVATKDHPSFFLTLLTVVATLLVVNQELITSFNYIDIDTLDQQVFWFRALTTTLWWVTLSAYLIYRGTKVLNYKPEKILGLVLLGITILKIVFYDLTHADTNLRIFILIVVGAIMLWVSYYANQKEHKPEIIAAK